MQKFILILVALFGFSSFADYGSGMSGGEAHGGMEEGMSGFLSLRYKPMGFEEAGVDPFTYRASVGMAGEVNDMVHWAVSVSTNTNQNFGSIGLSSIMLEQAYLVYMPMDGLSVKVGKMGWMPSYHKAGVLISEELYKEGAYLKYKHEMDDHKVYVKLGAYKLDSGNAPLAEGLTVEGKVGGEMSMSDYTAGVYVKALHDGLLKDDGVDAKTLAQLGVMVSSSAMVFPFGLFAHYFSDVDSFGDNHSYTGGVFVGKAGKANSVDMGDFGVAVSYYDINAVNYRVSWLNEDYVSGAGKGVSARAQYNPWDKTSFVVKYAQDLGDDAGDEASNLVAELMFVF